MTFAMTQMISKMRQSRFRRVAFPTRFRRFFVVSGIGYGVSKETNFK
jgi:hypothetical protein